MSTPGSFESGQHSLQGDRRKNQDRHALFESQGVILLALADGMGGHPKGEKAAQILIDVCKQSLEKSVKPVPEPERFLARLLQHAHQQIQRYGEAQEPAIDPRTTAVVCLVQGETAYWIHAGDSRFYLLRDGAIVRRTTDHSYVERLRQQGIIGDEETLNHPQRNYVTRCLGGNTPLPAAELGRERLRPGDLLALCSDGLWGSIDEELMIDTLFSDMPIASACRALVSEAAQSAFPESDNVTLIACRPLLADHPQTPSRRAAPKQPKDPLKQAIEQLQSAIEEFEEKKQQRQ